MRRILLIFAAFAAQITAVLLLARIVRMPVWQFNILISDAFVFGLSALLAFICYLRFAFKPAASLKSRVACVLASLFFSFVGCVASDLILPTTDKWLTKRYIAQMQPRLRSDPRFADIRLSGLSWERGRSEDMLYPYIPIFGSVATEDDRRALIHILHQSHPPAQISAVLVRIGNEPSSIQEVFRRAREDDKIP